LHYFFENAKTLHSFLRNVADCTKLGGYFIGTCYDGQRVFRMLRNKLKGESFCIQHDDYRVFEITKQYDETGFPDNEYSLGYAIDVYQESIRQTIREYLVNFEYLRKLMEDYGFTVVPKHDAKNMGLPNGMGSFELLFAEMEAELYRSGKRNPYSVDSTNGGGIYGTAPKMNEDEKTISFLNNYFVFRKTQTVNTEKITRLLNIDDAAQTDISESEDEEDAGKQAKRTAMKKYLKKSAKTKTADLCDDLVLADTDQGALSRNFIRPMENVPKLVISKYNPPKDDEMEDNADVIVRLDEEGFVEESRPEESQPIPDEQIDLNPIVIEQGKSISVPMNVVRGEVKKVIRVPKKKIQIKGGFAPP